MNRYTDQFKVDLPDMTRGKWEIDHFTIDAETAKKTRLRGLIGMWGGGGLRYVPEGHYTRLRHDGTTVMTDTPDEISDQLEPIHRAAGFCLVNGLGLGMVASAMLEKPEVLAVWVVEIDRDLIEMVGPIYKEKYGDKLVLIHADALEFKPPRNTRNTRFGVVWHDIWNDICEDNRDDISRLHRKYGRCCDWQGSWSRAILDRQRRQEHRH